MFKAKTVVITGGSSGLGEVLARRFLDRGTNVALIARNREKLSSVRGALVNTVSDPQRVEGFPCDVSRPDSVEKAFRSIAEALDPPNILINSAGILREGYFQEQSIEIFREVMDINFFGTLNCIKAVLPMFEQRGNGRIVNISSMAGLMGVFGYSAYCSSKHAIAGLSSVLRIELKPKNIKLHLVCPPEFESPMVDELNKNRTPENRELCRTLPVLDVDSVADAVMTGIEKERYEIIPGLAARVARRMDRLFPALAPRMADLRLRKHRDTGQ